MDAPVLTYALAEATTDGFAELDLVRILRPLVTDEGTSVPAGTRGTIVARYAEGAAFEVEFEVGLATVEREYLEAA